MQSFLHLARHRFYDRTICHRLTAYPTLKVLQCGDPSGTGAGGPGYRYSDELPTDLPPAPTDPTGERGSMHAARSPWPTPARTPTAASSSWSTRDSALRPNYTIFGTCRRGGPGHPRSQIAAGGVDPRTTEAPLDGPPALTHRHLEGRAPLTSAHPLGLRLRLRGTRHHVVRAFTTGTKTATSAARAEVTTSTEKPWM